MPKKDAYNNLVGFQWFFIVNSLCLRRKENKKRRYEFWTSDTIGRNIHQGKNTTMAGVPETTDEKGLLPDIEWRMEIEW